MAGDVPLGSPVALPPGAPPALLEGLLAGFFSCASSSFRSAISCLIRASSASLDEGLLAFELGSLPASAVWRLGALPAVGATDEGLVSCEPGAGVLPAVGPPDGELFAVPFGAGFVADGVGLFNPSFDGPSGGALLFAASAFRSSSFSFLSAVMRGSSILVAFGPPCCDPAALLPTSFPTLPLGRECPESGFCPASASLFASSASRWSSSSFFAWL